VAVNSSKLRDDEFGEITLRRTSLSRSIRLKLDSRGVISISLPKRAPLFLARQLLNDSRASIRNSLQKIRRQKTLYRAGDIIGKVHRLRIEQDDSVGYSHRLDKNELVVFTPVAAPVDMVQRTIHEGIAKALRVQAKSYLPRRLKTLADTHGFQYGKLRYSSAGTRWGSCSSEGTISLNIWLMQLPFELIDYVILHELSHTRYMNHSEDFWTELANFVPNYRDLRRKLKEHHPYA
jgi:predicted metal-dependent hydrolase